MKTRRSTTTSPPPPVPSSPTCIQHFPPQLDGVLRALATATCDDHKIRAAANALDDFDPLLLGEHHVFPVGALNDETRYALDGIVFGNVLRESVPIDAFAERAEKRSRHGREHAREVERGPRPRRVVTVGGHGSGKNYQ